MTLGTLDPDTIDTTDVDLWRDLHMDDDLKCEFQHVVIPCTVTVTHRIFSCDTSAFLCDSATARERQLQAKIVCSGCHQPAKKCWRIMPV